MDRVSLKAAVIGGLINVLGAILVPAIIGGIFPGAVLASADTRTPSAAVGSVAGAMVPPMSPMLLLIGLGVVAFAVAAGFVAGRVAGHDRVLNGAASSGLRIVIWLGWTVMGLHDRSAFSLVSIFVLGPALGAFGGFLSTLGQHEAAAPAE